MDLSLVKTEVAFFMDKVFQVSFAYFAGLVAILALTPSDTMKAVTKATDLQFGVISASIILVLNFVYATLATACLFAILKRGFFMIRHGFDNSGKAKSAGAEWEEYVRDESILTGKSGFVHDLAWNIDNYYMIPLFAFVPIASTGAAVYGFQHGDHWAWLITSALLLLHLIPVAIGGCVIHLNTLCRRELDLNRAKRAPS